MRILILQHAKVEHPGYFRELLDEDGHQCTTIHLNEGQDLPPIDNFEALWVLGGPMDVWEESKYPWLVGEKNFIKEAVVNKGVPYLGLCLGHQLLAEALGGEVGLAEHPEIGVMEVQLTEFGASGVFFDGLDERFKCLQWHSAEVTKLPNDVQILATSEKCSVQAMRWGTRAHSVQFHFEVEDETVENWASIQQYKKALEVAMGPMGVETLQKACEENMVNFKSNAERVYLNWMQTSART